MYIRRIYSHHYICICVCGYGKRIICTLKENIRKNEYQLKTNTSIICDSSRMHAPLFFSLYLTPQIYIHIKYSYIH